MSPPLPRLRSLPPLLLTALLAGCVSYAPQPIDLSGQAGAVEQARPIPVGTVLSESEALALALERSTGVRQARAAWETARAASRSARVSPGWTLNLTTEFYGCWLTYRLTCLPLVEHWRTSIAPTINAEQ